LSAVEGVMLRTVFLALVIANLANLACLMGYF
jgi:hypothetical protein